MYGDLILSGNGGFMEKVTGMMVYYYNICKRKLWFFCNEINMEEGNEDVKIGKLLDEKSYAREDKHINIDNVINIDFLNDKHILNEVKKSNKIEDASIWQVKYYLYYLKQRGVEVTARIDYPLLKKTLDVSLSEEDEKCIEEMIKEIIDISNLEETPKKLETGICKKCAYYDLCYI